MILSELVRTTENGADIFTKGSISVEQFHKCMMEIMGPQDNPSLASSKTRVIEGVCVEFLFNFLFFLCLSSLLLWWSGPFNALGHLPLVSIGLEHYVCYQTISSLWPPSWDYWWDMLAFSVKTSIEV